MTATNLGLNGNPAKFLGAYIANVSTNLGLAQSASTCNVTLAEDPPNTSFTEPELGSFRQVTVGSKFKFAGIITSWNKDIRNISGRQITVNLSDVREIMSAIPMILAPGFRNVASKFAGTDCSILDIFGAYDDFDGTGVNLSGWNQSGITYERIALALKGGIVLISSVTFNVVGQVGRAYGEKYRFNLDNLTAKVANPEFRINSNLISLSDFIQEMTQRNSLDWYVTAQRATDGIIDVTIHVIDRSTDNTDVDLQNFLDQNQNKVIESSKGYELRNEVACSALLGAPVEQMRTLNITGLANNPIDLSDEGGSSKYFMTEDEMRYVLGNKQSWKLWLSLNGGIDRYNLSGIQAAIQTPIIDIDGYGDIENQLGLAPGRARPGAAPNQEKRLGQIYEKLKGHAEATYGKRFLFAIPTDVDLIDAAWTADAIAGNNNPNEYFRQEDGKTRCFVEFIPTTTLVPTSPSTGFILGKGANAAQPLALELASTFNAANSVVELDKADWLRSNNNVNNVNAPGDRLYVAATIEEGGIVRIDTPIIEAAPTDREVQSLLETTRPVANVADAEGNTTAKGRRAQIMLIHLFGEYPAYGKIHAKAFQPRYVHVPVRSKFNRYGPVFSSNIDANSQGRVKIEQDDGFSPWEFGGSTLMLQAMQFKVDNESSSVKKVESATVNVEGFPKFSIGEALGLNSNINSININMQGQVTTTYELRSFLRKFGELSKQELAQLSLFARRGGARNIPQDNLAFINKYRAKISRQFSGRGGNTTSGLTRGALSFE